jgi:hypothetical protein
VSLWSRSARTCSRSIEAPARYYAQTARIVSGFLKQRRYSAKEWRPSGRPSRSGKGRHDVWQCHALDALRVIARQAVGPRVPHPRAASPRSM